jgi:branched-chain amino acid transport system substrate-binding protein
MNMKKLHLVCLNVMTVAATILFTDSISAQDLSVKIGHVAPTSGRIAAAGRASENGARLAIDELNAKGVSIGGSKAKFELLAEDDAADPNRSAAVAQKLVDARVNGVIGHLTSGTSIAASKTYSDAGIPQISPSATNPKFTRSGYKTTFRVLADDTQLGSALGRYAVRELKATRIAVIDDRSAYGQGMAEEFSKAATAAGGNLVDAQHTNDKATDFTEILAAVKSKNPDVVFFGGFDLQAGPMINQMKQLGINAKLMGGDGVCTRNLPLQAADAMTDGQVVCAEAGGVESGAPALAKFSADFKRKFGTDAEYYARYVYDAVMVMVDAMVRAGSSDPAKYLQALAATNGYSGITGPITFDEKGDIKNGALSLITYKGGKKEVVAVVR